MRDLLPFYAQLAHRCDVLALPASGRLCSIVYRWITILLSAGFAISVLQAFVAHIMSAVRHGCAAWFQCFWNKYFTAIAERFIWPLHRTCMRASTNHVESLPSAFFSWDVVSVSFPSSGFSVICCGVVSFVIDGNDFLPPARGCSPRVTFLIDVPISHRFLCYLLWGSSCYNLVGRLFFFCYLNSF